ncbi:hypothetical protein J7E25_00525 [Agromyces sp. ISL-38]|uniref:hypothetical protein n=1 Tax=Agromyces sp. ISL-38 TaxID=2819107 RepID=UPI001BECA8C5|nr:hypothetical protein [Agromyces sp. ISL-38]MBT2497576.1 hypothetical protein [Agromyces sp. ISL-38]
MRGAIERQPAESRAARHSAAARGGRARTSKHRSTAPAAAIAVIAIVATLALAPVTPAGIEISAAETSIAGGTAQTVTVAPDVTAPPISHESYTAATGPETLIANGTNEDWAKLVLIYGDWPVTDENVAVIMQWMREENGPDNWWNRNNPLNNGHGSGGGSGLGSYDSLDTAAFYAADNLLKRSFYTAIVAALEDGTSAAAVAQAIWASPWASSHYGNGANWTTSPVPIVEAPASAW